MKIDPNLVEKELAEVLSFEDFEIYYDDNGFQVYDWNHKLLIDADFYQTEWENLVHGLGFLDDQPLSQYLRQYLSKNRFNISLPKL